MRREILTILASAPARTRTVTDLVAAVRLPQPDVSKRLGVLRRAGLVSVRRQGQHRLYTVEAERLKPMNEWIKTFEALWDDQARRIRDHAEAVARRTRQSKAETDAPNPRIAKDPPR